MRNNENIYIGSPRIPCLKDGEHTYIFTPEELSELVRQAFYDGYQLAKSIYNQPPHHSASMWDVVKETEHGTH